MFGTGAFRFQPRFPPGAARDCRPPRGVNSLQTLDWYVVFEYKCVATFKYIVCLIRMIVINKFCLIRIIVITPFQTQVCYFVGTLRQRAWEG